MNNDDLIILATDLEGDTRVLAEKCRELIADLRIARQDAAQSKIEIKSLQNGVNILLATALEAAQQQLVENEIRLRIAGDDIAKLRETIADYQSLLKEG